MLEYEEAGEDVKNEKSKRFQLYYSKEVKEFTNKIVRGWIIETVSRDNQVKKNYELYVKWVAVCKSLTHVY